MRASFASRTQAAAIAFLAGAIATSCSPADPGIIGERPAGPGGARFDGGPIQAGDASADAGGIGMKCAGSITKADKVPLDILVMLDQSGSMLMDSGNGHAKWEEVVKAINAFASRPDAAGIGLGLQYFGQRDPTRQCAVAPCERDDDCGQGCGPCRFDGLGAGDGGPVIGVCSGATDGMDSCNPADYATVEVRIAGLPANATSIASSLARHRPYSGTPTQPALQGSLDYLRGWAMANPTHVVVNVLATDGVPGECDLDITHIEEIARSGFAGTPSIRTFVVGIRGPNDSLPGMPVSGLENLQGIAAAGGTDKAFLVTNNTSQQLLNALNTIRTTTLSCAYFLPMPMSGPIDPGKVNVEYTPGGATDVRIIPKVAGKSACTDDGWYYNDELPPKIVMCDFTCQALTADVDGKVEIQLGCATIVK